MSCGGRHPWYYVPGRKDLTEKLLSGRREKEAQKEENWRSASQYFAKCDVQSKIHKRWQDDRSMLKYQTGKKLQNEPPFDVLKAETKRPVSSSKESQEQYNNTCRAFAKLLDAYQEMQDNADDLKIAEQQMTTQLNELNEIKKTLEEKQDFWTLKNVRLFYVRFGRDKLRQKVFLILEQLEYYKSVVDDLAQMQLGEGILEECELTQISEVIESVNKIIKMYLQLNSQRNIQFQLLFHEEGEYRWKLQEPELEKEKEVWKNLVDKLIDCCVQILTDKLQDNILTQEEHLNKREEKLDQLSSFAAKIKRNPFLSGILEDVFS